MTQDWIAGPRKPVDHAHNILSCNSQVKAKVVGLKFLRNLSKPNKNIKQGGGGWSKYLIAKASWSKRLLHKSSVCRRSQSVHRGSQSIHWQGESDRRESETLKASATVGDVMPGSQLASQGVQALNLRIST